MLSTKTINWLTWKIETELPDLFARIPKNAGKYKNTFVDYRRMILEDKVKNLSFSHKDTLVKMINDKDEKGSEQFLFGVKGIIN